MTAYRTIKNIYKSRSTIEGAGVHLKRGFGFNEVPLFDPFLLFDDFRSTNPEHFIKGFPWHPHRGIETITYVLSGDVEHGDSLGNKGIISSGDVQWMTAGSGIIHQEMPKGDQNGAMLGFQLWANLPASHKMMGPSYRDVTSNMIPEIQLDSGVKIKVICGKFNNIQGPTKDIVIEPEYFDISVPPNTTHEHPTKQGHTVFIYVIEGKGFFSDTQNESVENESIVLFEDGDKVSLFTRQQGVRFLFMSGKPIGEPVAWRGPIVMNTQEELDLAFEEYRNGTFTKH